jgi:hypothetical protein
MTAAVRLPCVHFNRLHIALDFGELFIPGYFQVILRLKVPPELRSGLEVTCQPRAPYR